MIMNIRVGFGKRNITPDFSVPLHGYGNTLTRMSQGVLHPLYVTCVAISDENDSTVLLITADVLYGWPILVDPVRQKLFDATGISPDRILVQGTHTHSAPDIWALEELGNMTFHNQYIEGAVGAAMDALSDLESATIQVGQTYTENLNFVRHYILADGSYYGDNFGDLKKGGSIVRHAFQPDNQMQVIRFVRENKKDIVMVNWQAHAKVASTAETPEGKKGRPYISSDYLEPARNYVEATDDVLVAFFLGAAGNLNPRSKVPGHCNPPEFVDDYGLEVGKYICKALENTQPAATGQVKAKQVLFQAQRDHTEDRKVEDAKKVQALWRKTNDYAQCVEFGSPFGVMSPYHADSIIMRSGKKEICKMELDAVAVGELGFITAPYEMFCSNGKFVKEHSPFPTTFVISCANGQNNYIADDAAFDYGSYEVHNRALVRGTAEKLADTFVDMLKELK